MKRKANPAQVPRPQLELPYVQQSRTRSLAYYIGVAKVFAAYHKRWPTRDATREEFRAARLPEDDGQRLDRELRFPGPELEADPAYRALRERCLADGLADGVDLKALDPRYRSSLPEEGVAELFETIALPGQAGPGAVRYATGVPAHGPGELTLQLGDALRAAALARAGLDPEEPGVRARAYSVRVQATDALRSFMDRIGLPHPPAHEGLADHYLLEADDGGRLHIRFQLLAGSRYVGGFDIGRLVEQLASVFAAGAER